MKIHLFAVALLLLNSSMLFSQTDAAAAASLAEEAVPEAPDTGEKVRPAAEVPA